MVLTGKEPTQYRPLHESFELQESSNAATNWSGTDLNSSCIQPTA